MDFKLVKITNHFVLDKNTFKIYEVSLGANKKIENYRECCTMKYDKEYGEYRAINRQRPIAIGVIEKAKMILSKIDSMQ